MSKKQLDDSEYIIIPNPIYDVVFRYLMSDPGSAIIVLSTLINENITKVHFDSLMHSDKKEAKEKAKIIDPKTKDDLKLFHLDFTATVELPNGQEEIIMIELQKASEPDDIFRFKRYISKNFQKKHRAEILDPVRRSIITVDKPIRLIPIFILNFRIENEINDLLIKTNRIKTGVFKNKTLKSHNEFIDNLSFDMYVVQLPNLNKINPDDYKNDDYKSKLYALLKLFDQKSKVKSNAHRLRLIRKFFPGFLDRVVRRLQAADINNPKLEEQMYAEDEYLRALIERDNKISFMMERWDSAKKDLDTANKKLDTTKEKLDTTKEKLDTTKEKLDTTKEELDTTKEELDAQKEANKQMRLKLAKTLKDIGMPIEKIMEQTDLSKFEIEKL